MNYMTEFMDDGRIVATHSSTQKILPSSFGEGVRFLPIQSDLERDYISEGKAVQRPQFGISWRGHILAGVPCGAEIFVDGVPYVADGSDIDLSFDMPGTYLVRVALWPYLDWEVVIENPA